MTPAAALGAQVVGVTSTQSLLLGSLKLDLRHTQ
jgi:hypothetical protein